MFLKKKNNFRRCSGLIIFANKLSKNVRKLNESFLHNPSVENELAFKQLKAKSTPIIWIQKETSWRNSCFSFTSKSKPKTVWITIIKIKAKPKNKKKQKNKQKKQQHQLKPNTQQPTFPLAHLKVNGKTYYRQEANCWSVSLYCF